MKVAALILLTVLAVASAERKQWIPLMPTVTPNPQNAPLRTLMPQPKPRTRAPVPGTTAVANCGVAPALATPPSRIINGQEAVPHSYPWQVALYIDNTYFCGGSLISTEWVLTAAHCTTGSRSIRVVMGAHNLEETEASQVEMTTTDIITNADYGSTLLRNDVGLVHLPSSVTLTPEIVPICLPSYSDADVGGGIQLTASGWGITSDSVFASISDVLNEVTNPSIENSECANTYSITVSTDTICTDTSAGDKGTCSGDSGGPLMWTSGGKTYSRGVTSFVSSSGCGSGLPDGFTRTAHFLDWIETNTGIAIDA